MHVARTTAPTVEVGTVLATITDDGKHPDDPDGRAVVTTGNDSTNVTISVPGSSPNRPQRVQALLQAALAEIEASVGGPVHWWVHGATALDEEIAATNGLTPGRTLLQLRRALPTGMPVVISTRPFRPGADEAAWLRLNNRAFEGHPEQGGWTAATLAQRMAEPWFDPAGFLVHERDGRLAGACWTKLHPAHDDDPELGEIYVIGVDPDYHGLGLGPQLTLAGLASIEGRGVRTGMLYVDAVNRPAVRMYDRLGFKPHRIDRAFTFP